MVVNDPSSPLRLKVIPDEIQKVHLLFITILVLTIKWLLKDQAQPGCIAGIERDF